MPEELKNIPGHGESREGRRLDYLSNKNSPRMQDFAVLVISDFKPQTFLRTMPLEYENIRLLMSNFVPSSQMYVDGAEHLQSQHLEGI